MKSLFLGCEVDKTDMFGVAIDNCFRADGSISTTRVCIEFRYIARLVAKLLIWLLLAVFFSCAGLMVLSQDQKDYERQDFAQSIYQVNYENPDLTHYGDQGDHGDSILPIVRLFFITFPLILVMFVSIYSMQQYRKRVRTRKRGYEYHDARAMIAFR